MDEKQDQPFQFSINARPNKTAAAHPAEKAIPEAGLPF